MISVLRSWNEIGEAILDLQRRGLPQHETPQKNWDHRLLSKAFGELAPGSRIVDLGSGRGFTLDFMHALGQGELHGIDLAIPWTTRYNQLRAMLKARQLRPPYRIRKGTVTRTGYPPEFFDLAVSISTIEHGVDAAAFFAESFRILRPGAALLVTTDYWHSDTPNASPILYGVPWRPLTPKGINSLICHAQNAGFRCEDDTIPECVDPIAYYSGFNYTFLGMTFTRQR